MARPRLPRTRIVGLEVTPMFDPRLVLSFAARAGCDIRTARAYLVDGREPRGHLLRARLRDAEKALGLERYEDPSPNRRPPRSAA